MTGRGTRQTPAYVRAQDAVLELVRSEGFAPGSKVPSERTLATRLGLSRMTVRQGIENLVRAGVLIRAGTSGTRLADINVMRVIDSRRAFSMSQMVRSSGARPGSQLLMFALTRADRDLAIRLNIEIGDPVLRMRRLRTANDLPFCIELSSLPAALVPGLIAQDLAKNMSLYQLLRDRYGVVPIDRNSEISVGPVTAEDARLLGLTPGINVLLYTSIVKDADGRVIESVSSVNHPERVVFSTHSAHIKI